MITAKAPKRNPDPFSLGLDLSDSIQVHKAILTGLPFSVLTRFEKATGLSRPQLAKLLAVGERTLDRRQKEKKLHAEESERLCRLANLYRLAIELFNGNTEAAGRWLQTPRPALGGEVPLDLARTEVGARRVETLIGQLEHGVYV